MQSVVLDISPEYENTQKAQELRARFGNTKGALTLRLDGEGLTLVSDGNELRGDFARLLPRIKQGKLGAELLVKAAKIKGVLTGLTAFDATAGLGEDSFLLAAAGFSVDLYEHNPVVYALLCDALERAAATPELAEIVGRMRAHSGDSLAAMASLESSPDIILLDPMFPERQKTALVKKKLQIIQRLEIPCANEREMFLAAVNAKPKKLIVKRPPKGAWLADFKPDYAIEGKAVRFDCFVAPHDKLHLYK